MAEQQQEQERLHIVPQYARRRVLLPLALLAVSAIALIAWRGEAILLDLSALAAMCF